MAPIYNTTAHGLRWLPGGNLASDIDAGFQALAEDVDTKLLTSATAIIATEESRSNATAGTLTTPDTVSLTIPSTDCLVLVSYIADIKESTQNTTRLTFTVSNGSNFSRVPANPGTALTATVYGGFFFGVAGASSTAADVPGVWINTAVSGDPGIPMTELAYNPVATGTWTYTVKFATTSGATVTVRNRKLRARLVTL